MKKIKSTYRASGYGLMLLLFLFGAIAAGCGKHESEAQSQTDKERLRKVPVSTEEVRPRPIRDVLVLPGETEAWQDVRVPSDIAGRVEWIGFREGDAVKKGELIGKVDVSALKAALDRAQAAFDLADQVYRRRLELYQKKLIAQEELDRSRTERSLAVGNLEQARVEYERGFIRAPVSGVVNHLFVDQGEFIGRGEPFADIVNIERIEVIVDAPEMDVRYLEKGQQAEVRIDAFPGRKVIGFLDFVAYKANPATKTFRIKVLIENREREIRPGMIAKVAFLRRVIDDALTAPLFALVDKSGERILYVEEEGIARARTVSLGVVEKDRVQITEGLAPGDHLIVKGQNELEEGMRVEVKK